MYEEDANISEKHSRGHFQRLNFKRNHRTGRCWEFCRTRLVSPIGGIRLVFFERRRGAIAVTPLTASWHYGCTACGGEADISWVVWFKRKAVFVDNASPRGTPKNLLPLLHTHPEFLRKNITPLLQPLDLGVIACVKNQYKNMVAKRAVNLLDARYIDDPIK